MNNLPAGYVFVERESMSVSEVVALRESVGWTNNNEQEMSDCLRDSIDVCGVRDQNGALIGIDFLAGNRRHAVLCDFSVHPDHQGQGIGRAILQQRLRKLDELKIPYLYGSLSNENSLRRMYEDAGFTDTGNLLFKEKR